MMQGQQSRFCLGYQVALMRSTVAMSKRVCSRFLGPVARAKARCLMYWREGLATERWRAVLRFRARGSSRASYSGFVVMFSKTMSSLVRCIVR